MEQFLLKTREFEFEERTRLLRGCVDAAVGSMQGLTAVVLADALFKHSVQKLEEKAYEECGSTLQHAARELRRVESCMERWRDVRVGAAMEALFPGRAGVATVCEVADGLSADVHHQLDICESVRLRSVADGMQEQALRGGAELNVDLMWDAVDCYKQAILKTRERDIESEVTAVARLALVFDKILVDQKRARRLYVFSSFRTRITTCYSDRVETGPDFVPGLPHVVAHFSQVPPGNLAGHVHGGRARL